MREQSKMVEPEDEDSMQGSNKFVDQLSKQLPIDSEQAAMLRGEKFGQQ